MKKLIDADELLSVLSPTVQGDGRLFDPDVPMADVRGYVREMPGVEAIPVQWLNKMKARADSCGDRMIAAAVNYILCVWKTNKGKDISSSNKK